MTSLLEHTDASREKAASDILKQLSRVPKNSRSRKYLEALFTAWGQHWKEVGLVPILPLLFQLKGKPYDVMPGHFPMVPLFLIYNLARKLILKCGRQVSKSTTLAYAGTAHSMLQPYLQTVFVTPLYEQVRRFSQNYARQAMMECTIRDQIIAKGKHESVLQRGFSNGSNMFFSFAFRDCERLRGINADSIRFDEIQGMDFTFLPIIREAMTASDFRIEHYSGTPLTMDNTIERLWQDSSMAEWLIPCPGCKHRNIACNQYDMLKMIGPWNDEYKTGLRCSKCDKPLNCRTGNWWHQRSNLRHEFPGFHAPQIIFPMHANNQDRWQALLDKMEKDEFSFMTECMGESWDAGAKLVTMRHLQEASILEWKNNENSAQGGMSINQYVMRVLSIDWSGGGSKQESLTAFAVLGIKASGHIDVIWMKKFQHSNDYAATAASVRYYYDKFFCQMLVHDYGGAGIGREQILVHSGFPEHLIIPITYVRAAATAPLMVFKEPPNETVRASYSLDKARSLVLTCELIKQGYIHFPDWKSSEECLRDFLALVEETLITPRGADIFLISKAQGVPDDMAHAINIGVCALYYQQGKWPDLAKSLKTPSGNDPAPSTLEEAHPDTE